MTEFKTARLTPEQLKLLQSLPEEAIDEAVQKAIEAGEIVPTEEDGGELLVIEREDGSVSGIPIRDPESATGMEPPVPSPDNRWALLLMYPDGHEETRLLNGPDIDTVSAFAQGMGFGMNPRPASATVLKMAPESMRQFQVDQTPIFDSRLAYELMSILSGNGKPGERPIDALGFLVTPQLHQLLMWKKVVDSEMMQEAIDVSGQVVQALLDVANRFAGSAAAVPAPARVVPDKQ